MNTTLEEKVTKTEMIDMIVYEETERVEAELEAFLKGISKSKNLHIKIDGELSKVYEEAVNENYKDLIKDLKKIYGIKLTYRASFCTLKKQKKTTPVHIYYLNPVFSTGVNKEIINLARGNRTFQWKVSVTATGLSLTLPIKETASVKKFLKKVKEGNKTVDKIYDKYSELLSQKSKLINGSKAAKAKLIRRMLESSTEGKSMLKQLSKIKMNISKGLLLSPSKK